MEEEPAGTEEAPERAKSGPLRVDFARCRDGERGGGPGRGLAWGGMLGALVLMVAGSLVTMVAEQRWGIYLFLAAAVLYLFCRCMTIGMLSTAPKAFSVVLLIGGAFILSRWPPPSAMGMLGIACLAGALALMLIGGLGYLRKRDGLPPKRNDAP